jgi:hypothetical protein
MRHPTPTRSIAEARPFTREPGPSALRLAAFLLSCGLVSCGLASCGGSDKQLTVNHLPPAVTITQPTDGAALTGGEAVTFAAQVDSDRDAEESLLLAWSSDRDGVLSTEGADVDGNARFTTTLLSSGTHVITLQVTDSAARSAEDFITVEVSDAIQAPEIDTRKPNAADFGVAGVPTVFEVLVSDPQEEPPGLVIWFESDLDGVFCEPTADADGLAACSFALSAGDHTLTFGVSDADGNEATATLPWSVIAASASDDDLDGYTEDEGDCDDADPSVAPGATEYANGIDDDCDGEIDEGTTNSDDDLDGFTEGDGDCDDGDENTYPGALEVCDGADNDCDTAIDEGTSCIDDDGDGYSELEGDCDDSSTSAYPGASELPDGVDNDCDLTIDEGTTLYDDDGDCFCESGTCTGSADATCTTLADGDCKDTDDTVSPAAAEVCDSIDNDCDGSADPSTSTDAATWYRDADSDNYGNASVTTKSCTLPTGYVANDDDCDDSKAAVSPVGVEVCDSIDNNCDGATDETTATDALTWYRDVDADTYGTSATTTKACTKPTGYVASSTDCNDGAAAINPAATELCDLVDNDCDSTIDESSAADAATWYLDIDGDNYGVSTTTTKACTRPSGYASVSTDCNDASAAISPAATEVCDSVDNDCDSSTDEGVTTTYYRDADGDGYGVSTTTKADCSLPSGYSTLSTDCDDTNASLNPTTVWYRDVDGDGYGNATTTKAQCLKPTGYVADSSDCNDSSSSANPGKTETCDTIDNDCDGTIDEQNATGCTAYYVDADADGYGKQGSSSKCYCSATSTYTATTATDCYDSNSAANPGATAYSSVDRGDGSYDYNCDSSQEKRYTDVYDCTGAVYVCVDYTNGWTSSAPSCGSSATWRTGCSASLTSCTYSGGTSRTQTCR